MKQGCKDMAQRMANARLNFCESLSESFDLSLNDAETVLDAFVRAKAVKLDAVNGRYNLKHGAFWDRTVINRALGIA